MLRVKISSIAKVIKIFVVKMTESTMLKRSVPVKMEELSWMDDREGIIGGDTCSKEVGGGGGRGSL